MMLRLNVRRGGSVAVSAMQMTIRPTQAINHHFGKKLMWVWGKQQLRMPYICRTRCGEWRDHVIRGVKCEVWRSICAQNNSYDTLTHIARESRRKFCIDSNNEGKLPSTSMDYNTYKYPAIEDCPDIFRFLPELVFSLPAVCLRLISSSAYMELSDSANAFNTGILESCLWWVPTIDDSNEATSNSLLQILSTTEPLMISSKFFIVTLSIGVVGCKNCWW